MVVWVHNKIQDQNQILNFKILQNIAKKYNLIKFILKNKKLKILIPLTVIMNIQWEEIQYINKLNKRQKVINRYLKLPLFTMTIKDYRILQKFK